MTEKEILWSKTQLFYNALSKRDKWYTGLSIKRYLRTQVFAYKPEFNNPAITTGRWSAYCHYSLILSFKNLLDKHGLTKGQTVLIHPLLPFDLIQEIQSQGYMIKTLDIEKTTLCFDPEKLKKLLEQEQIDLIIYPISNGLYGVVADQLDIIKQHTIPTLLFVDEPNINFELLNLFEKLTLGSVLWNFGDSFLDEEIQDISGQQFDSQSWYISWFVETRTRSILEYHLSSSQDNFEPIVEALFFLLLEKYKKKDFRALPYFVLAKNFFLKNKFKKTKEAKELLDEKYLTVFESAIPDLIFDLSLLNKTDESIKAETMVHNSSKSQQKVKALYEFLISQIPSRPEGTLEITDFYLDKTYLRYFFFTTETDYWLRELTSRGFKVSGFNHINPEIIANLEQASFISNYGIEVRLN